MKIEKIINNLDNGRKGRTTLYSEEVLEAINFYTNLGVHVLSDINEASGKSLNIVINNSKGDSVTFVNAFTVKMNETTLVNTAMKIKSPASISQLISVLVDAVHDIDTEQYSILMKAKVDNIVEGFISTLSLIIRDSSRINERAIKNIIKYLGGVTGAKLTFTEIINNMTETGEVAEDVIHDKCKNCIHCRFEDDFRYCRICIKSIPEDLTIREVNEIFTRAEMYNGVLVSKYTPYSIPKCNSFSPRN